MKVEFIEFHTALSKETVSRTNIAHIEKWMNGVKITLHTKDEKGKDKIIIANDNYEVIIALLNQ